MASITSLPTELLTQIFEELPWYYSRRLSRVCQRWRSILLPSLTDDPSSLWHNDYEPNSVNMVCPRLTYAIYVSGRYYGRIYVILGFSTVWSGYVGLIQNHRVLVDVGHTISVPLSHPDHVEGVSNNNNSADTVTYHSEGGRYDSELSTNRHMHVNLFEEHARKDPRYDFTPQEIRDRELLYDEFKHDPLILRDGRPMSGNIATHLKFCSRRGLSFRHSTEIWNPRVKLHHEDWPAFSVRYEEEPPHYITLEDLHKNVVLWAHHNAAADMLEFISKLKEAEKGAS